MNQHPPTQQHTHLHIDEVAEDASKGFELDGLSYFAVKKDGDLYIYKNACPHLGIELNWQEDQFLDADNALVQCATHGALFLIESGQCVSGPCLGEHLVSIPFDIRDGYIFLNTEN